MTLLRRVIVCLDVQGDRVVKGVNFVGLRDAGDPVEVARRYNEQGADELTFLDITASSDQRDHSRHAVRAAVTAPSISAAPAWCTRASTCRWRCGLVNSRTFPVRISWPPTITGISTTCPARSWIACFSVARSGVPGA